MLPIWTWVWDYLQSHGQPTNHHLPKKCDSHFLRSHQLPVTPQLELGIGNPSLYYSGIFNCINLVQLHWVHVWNSCALYRDQAFTAVFQPPPYILFTPSSVMFLILKWNIWCRCLIFGKAFTVVYSQNFEELKSLY